jgi:hypothetical protein
MRGQDPNMSQDAHGAHVPRYRLLAGPSFSTPRSKGRPRVVVEPSVGQPSNSWAFMGCSSVFSSVSLLPAVVHGPWGDKPPSDASYEGVVRDGKYTFPRGA